jgi:hypothetical protein
VLCACAVRGMVVRGMRMILKVGCGVGNCAIGISVFYLSSSTFSLFGNSAFVASNRVVVTAEFVKFVSVSSLRLRVFSYGSGIDGK